MKKFISVLILLAIVLSCCACGAGNGTTEPVETTEATVSTEPEIINGVKKPDLSKVDEFTPNAKGVYQIYSKEGFLNIANHPDAEFELLWHIDMGGAEWTPVGTKAAPFTGEINGGQFTVSNLVINTPTADGDMGMFGVVEGQVKDLTLRNVTVTTNENTVRAGLWAGHNTDDGQFLRCYVEESALIAEKAADNAAIGSIVGVNEGEFRNGTMDVDLTVTASGKADIGGIAGYAADGKIQFVKNAGFIDVTGAGNKNYGLFAGAMDKNALIKGAVFLGEKSDADGEMFLQYTGSGDASGVEECLWRDNRKEAMDPVIQEKRDIVEAYMREMCSIVWRVPKTLKYSCTCSLSSCAGMYQPSVEIHGMVYNHKGGSLERLKYCLDEDNVLKEEFYMGDFDGFDNYIGNDCSTAVIQAYWTVSADINFSRTSMQWPQQYMGCVAVGDWEWNLDPMPTYTDGYLIATGEERMYEAYACLRKADFIVNSVQAGGHTRMLAQDAVVVRDSNGKIDGMESYVVTHEQGAARTLEPYFSSCLVDRKISFSGIFLDWYVPATIEDFVTGEFEEPMAELRDGGEGKLGLTTGTVYSNFFLDSVTMNIQDSTGETVFNQRMFTTVAKHFDTNHTDTKIRVNNHEYDMAYFATPLREFMFELGEQYHVTITAQVGSGDVFTVREFDFTNGSAT